MVLNPGFGFRVLASVRVRARIAICVAIVGAEDR